MLSRGAKVIFNIGIDIEHFDTDNMTIWYEMLQIAVCRTNLAFLYLPHCQHRGYRHNRLGAVAWQQPVQFLDNLKEKGKKKKKRSFAK